MSRGEGVRSMERWLKKKPIFDLPIRSAKNASLYMYIGMCEDIRYQRRSCESTGYSR